jgi:hypothetical protein
VGGNVDRYIDAASGRYTAGYSQNLGGTAIVTITIIMVGVIEVISFLARI